MTPLIFSLVLFAFVWLLCGFIAWGFFFASISVSPILTPYRDKLWETALGAFVYGPVALWVALTDFADDGWRLW